MIDKIVLLHEEYQSKKLQTFSVITHHNEDVFKAKYTINVLQRIPEMYLHKERCIYQQNTPAYNTTGALCRNAANGNPYFRGTTMVLKPLEDLQGILQAHISEFLDSTKNQFLELENEELDKDLKIEFLTDEIKQQFSQQSSDFLSKIIVTACKNTWQTLANDSGSGVKQRRANGIYNLLKFVVSMEEVNLKILEILTECIDNIIEAYTVRMG